MMIANNREGIKGGARLWGKVKFSTDDELNKLLHSYKLKAKTK